MCNYSPFGARAIESRNDNSLLILVRPESLKRQSCQWDQKETNYSSRLRKAEREIVHLFTNLLFNQFERREKWRFRMAIHIRAQTYSKRSDEDVKY